MIDFLWVARVSNSKLFLIRILLLHVSIAKKVCELGDITINLDGDGNAMEEEEDKRDATNQSIVHRKNK